MTARKPDPVISAWDRLQAAGKAHTRSYDALDEAEAKARRAGFQMRRPSIEVQGRDCFSVADVRQCAKGLPADKVTEAVEVIRTALAAWQRERRKAGVAPFDVAAKRGLHAWRAAMQAMADTRATTLFGVMLKLKIIAVELRDGETGFGEAILASAIADLGRIARK